LVANCAAEASLQKRLNQFPGQCRPDYLPAERKDIHVVVLNALVSGEHVMDETRAHTGNLVGADGGSHATAAERYSTINRAGGYGPGQWDNVIRVIVSGAQLMSAEVHDLVARASEQLRDLFL
jgi:hypothetical protein